MIALDSLFSLAGGAALVGWGVLAASTLSGFRNLRRIVPGLLVPVGLGVAYVVLMIVGFPRSSGGYGDLDSVARLFEDRTLLLAGWIHYLAFDLLVGVYLAEQNEAVGIPRLLMLPVFAATFLFGPAGFLLFQALRGVAGRRPLASGAMP
jgi:hypothetical protein